MSSGGACTAALRTAFSRVWPRKQRRWARSLWRSHARVRISTKRVDLRGSRSTLAPAAQWVQTRVPSGTQYRGQTGWSRPDQPHLWCTKPYFMCIWWCS